jgi:hypothetical protein
MNAGPKETNRPTCLLIPLFAPFSLTLFHQALPTQSDHAGAARRRSLVPFNPHAHASLREAPG